jgi:hypothetical protein
MSVTSAAMAAGRSNAGFGNNANTAGSSNIPGFGNMFGGRNRGGLMGMTQDLLNKARARRAARKAGAVGSATSAVGGNDSRFTSIESRLEALEGGGGGDLTAQGTGGAVKQDLATVTSGAMPEAPQAAGSLSEAMPGPEAASMDIFGSEFARNSAVGAAKMKINKKI